MTVAMSAMRMGNFEGGFGGIGLTVGGTGGGAMGRLVGIGWSMWYSVTFCERLDKICVLL